jgi:hypothetical protein
MEMAKSTGDYPLNVSSFQSRAIKYMEDRQAPSGGADQRPHRGRGNFLHTQGDLPIFARGAYASTAHQSGKLIDVAAA